MIIKLLITYQILIINLILTHSLAKAKYKNWVTVSVILSFTIALNFILSYASPLFASEVPSPWFIVAGILYIIPLYFLYQIRIRELLIIMVYCWTYTMVITSIAVGIASLFDVFSSNVEILLSQTILLIPTFFIVLRFTKSKFMIIVQSSSNVTRSYLMILGISMFSTITGVRYFISPEQNIYYILVILLVIIVITTYNLLFYNVESGMHLDSAKRIVYLDTLTGIANRYSLFRDLHKNIVSKTEFILLFLDLDSLKKVNDSLGHNKGDKYLIHFANTLIKQIQNQGTAYRFAGDEFVCIFPKTSTPLNIDKFENQINAEMNQHFQFNGVSIGKSEYPTDGNDPDILLQVADGRMYSSKKSKKIRLS